MTHQPRQNNRTSHKTDNNKTQIEVLVFSIINYWI